MSCSVLILIHSHLVLFLVKSTALSDEHLLSLSEAKVGGAKRRPKGGRSEATTERCWLVGWLKQSEERMVK